MCICQNFLVADEILKKEIDVLLTITKQATNSLPYHTSVSHDESIINDEEKNNLQIKTLPADMSKSSYHLSQAKTRISRMPTQTNPDASVQVLHTQGSLFGQ